jgi:hypothetical protein
MTCVPVARSLAITGAILSLCACGRESAYWRGNPSRDAAAAEDRGESGPIALREGDSLIVPGLPDSLRGMNLNMTFGRIDSVTLATVATAQRDSVITYVAAYNGPIFQAVLRARARRPRTSR